MEILDWAEGNAEKLVQKYLDAEPNEVFSQNELKNKGDYYIGTSSSGDGETVSIDVCFGDEFEKHDNNIDKNYEYFTRFAEDISDNMNYDVTVMTNSDDQTIMFQFTDWFPEESEEPEEDYAKGGKLEKAYEVILQLPNGKMNKRAILLAKTKDDASKKALNLKEFKQYGYVVVSANEIKYASGGKVKEKVFIEYLNKDKGFKMDRKYFNSYQEAERWARNNFDKFNTDYIRYEYAKGGQVLDLKDVYNELRSKVGRLEINEESKDYIYCDIRDWGNWEHDYEDYERDEEDFEDDDSMILSESSAKKMQSIVEEIRTKYPTASIRWNATEKNYIDFKISRKQTMSEGGELEDDTFVILFKAYGFLEKRGSYGTKTFYNRQHNATIFYDPKYRSISGYVGGGEGNDEVIPYSVEGVLDFFIEHDITESEATPLKKGGEVSNPYEEFLLENGFRKSFEVKNEKFTEYRKGRWYCFIDKKRKEIEVGKYDLDYSDADVKKYGAIREDNAPLYHSDRYTHSFTKFKKFLDNYYISDDKMAKGGLLVQVGDKIKTKSGIQGVVYESTGQIFKLMDSLGVKSNTMHFAKDFKKGDIKTYGRGGMDVGRWYRDKSGEEFKYIGEDVKGQSLFNDGKKVMYKPLEDFEGVPEEKKLFKFFRMGGALKQDFLEDVAEMHDDIKEITLKDGSKITHDELMEAHQFLEPDETQEYYASMQYGKGGTFDSKVEAISKKLVGKPVPKQYRKEYGSRYDKQDADEAARRIVGNMRKLYGE